MMSFSMLLAACDANTDASGITGTKSHFYLILITVT